MSALRLPFVSLLILGLLLTTSSVQAQGASPVEVRVAPAAVQVAAGQSVDVAVEVRDVQALYGADISMSFDPDVVEVVDADPDTAGVQVAMGTFLDSGFAPRNTVDNAAGTLHFAMTQLNPSQPKSGSGAIIVIELRGKQAGASAPLTLVSARLVQRDGAELPATLVSGQVEVLASAGAQPTPTPIPTQGAGLSLPTWTPVPTSAPPTATPTARRTTQRSSSTPAATSLRPTVTPRATNTPVPAEPTPFTATSAPAVTPTSVPLTPAPAEPTPTTQNLPAKPTATSTPVSAPPTTPAGNVVAQVRPNNPAPPSAISPGDAPSDAAPTGGYGLVGAAGLAVALLVVAAALVVAWRRSTHGS